MFSPSTATLVAALWTTFLLTLWRYRKCTSSYAKQFSLPPGPKPLPFIGNVLDVPKAHPWLTFRDMAVKYGDVVHISVLGQSLIILSSSQAAYDLLDKRSAIYSDRPRSQMVSLMGWDWNFALMPYGLFWRRIRRTFSQHFHSGVVQKYQAIQAREARRLLRRLVEKPDRFVSHIRYAFGATMLKVVHGIEVAEYDDKLITILEECVEGPTEGLVPGKFLVEYFPVLRHVPAWVPGAGFQRKITKWLQQSTMLVEVPFGMAKEAYNKGTASESMIRELLEEMSHLDQEAAEEEEVIVRNAGAVAYGAGADTTFSTMQGFFLAMVLFPEVQKKAQAELDAVVGTSRFPDFSDRDSLPYINAVIMECLRWHNVAPMGVPHRSLEDDVYKDYYIPKGSTVSVNVWALLHDPEIYHEPERFLPDRFIKDGKLNPEVLDPMIAFGFGRRICPGRHFADSSLFINVASVLHALYIHPVVDESGEPIPVKPDFTSGFLSYPNVFKCGIKPRSTSLELMIRAVQL